MNALEAYIQFTPGLVTDDGEVTVQATEQFLREFMVQAKNVRIVPETNQTSENAPSHRVLVGRAEIGAAWSSRSHRQDIMRRLMMQYWALRAPLHRSETSLLQRGRRPPCWSERVSR